MDKVLGLLANNPAAKNATIIIHGDHGSRILNPEPQNNQHSPENLMQYFSTFFVVKSPLFIASYDRRMLPLDVLLKNIILGQEPPNDDLSDRFVYLRKGELFDLGRLVMPEFSAGVIVPDKLDAMVQQKKTI